MPYIFLCVPAVISYLYVLLIYTHMPQAYPALASTHGMCLLFLLVLYPKVLKSRQCLTVCWFGFFLEE